MANEAVTIELPAALNAKQRTVAAATSISQGTLLKLTDPNTASATVTADLAPAFAGIAAADKDGGDADTKLSAYIDGVFDLTVAPNGSATIGAWVVISGANLIDVATEAQVLLGGGVGIAEETGGASEVIRVRLRGH